MKLVKIVKEYYEYTTDNKIDNLSKLMKENQNDEYINYFFEVGENDEVVIFANLYAFDLQEDDVERIFQIETAVIVKDTVMGDDYTNTLFYLGDNDTVHTPEAKTLQTKPVWEEYELLRRGVEEIKEAGITFPNRYRHYSWKDFV